MSDKPQEFIRPGRDLFGSEKPATYLPEEAATIITADDAGADIDNLAQLAENNPKDSGVWAALANRMIEQDRPVVAYACARTGYHRGLDALRANGWRGTGPVPWDHVPNQGVLRAIGALALAAKRIDEDDEVIRLLNLLNDCDPAAVPAMNLTGIEAR